VVFKIIILIIIFYALIFAGSNKDDRKETTEIYKNVDITSEKSIYTDISLCSGVIYLEKASSDKVFEGEFKYVNNSPDINYEVIGTEGRLTIIFDDEKSKQKGEEKKFSGLSSLDHLYENECRLKLSSEIPINLNIDLGVVKGELKLGGLQLKEINLASGVSKTLINFDDSNPILLEYFDVEAGVGVLKIYNLGNANFKRFNFEGGIGDYLLDFAGNKFDNSKVDIDVGLGKVKLYLPKSAGVRMRVDKSFLCSFDIDDIYKKDDFYYNESWGKTENNMDMNIETGIGNISVVWIED
jgi:hypothetical protein